MVKSVLRSVLGSWVWCWGLRLLTLVHWSVSLWIRWNSGSSCSAEWWRSSLPTFFHLNLYTRQGLFWRPLSLLNLIVEPTIWIFNSFTGYDLRLSMWFCLFSRPRPAGDEWDLWSLPLDLSLLSSEILPAAFTISFFASRCPRAAGSESLKCFFFTFPFQKIFFKMSVCSRLVFVGKCFKKVASLGVLISLSPAVFFLWLYYSIAMAFRLFAERTILSWNICAY